MRMRKFKLIYIYKLITIASADIWYFIKYILFPTFTLYP